MGWASASEIFDPVCELIALGVQKKAIPAERATEVLTGVIAKLQDNDWDTEWSSLERFSEHAFVVAAFAAQGVELDDEDDDEDGPQ